MAIVCGCDTFTTEVAVVPGGFGGSSGTGVGNIDLAGGTAALNVWRRTLVAFPGSPAAGDRYALYSPDGTLRVYTPGAGDLLTITATGNVGLGTTTADRKLTLANGGELAWRNAADTTTIPVAVLDSINNLSFRNDSGGHCYLGTLDGGTWLFLQTGGVSNLVVDPSGNVGIGSQAPAARLEVSTGAGGVGQGGVAITNSPTAGHAALTLTNNYLSGQGGDNVLVQNASGTVLHIDNAGNATVSGSITSGTRKVADGNGCYYS